MSFPKIREIKFLVQRPNPSDSMFLSEEFTNYLHLANWCAARDDIRKSAEIEFVDNGKQSLDDYISDHAERFLAECKYDLKKIPVEPEECSHFFEDGVCECGVEQDFSDVVNRAHEISEGMER